MLLDESAGIASSMSSSDAVAAALIEALQRHAVSFALQETEFGLEFRPQNELQGRNNRAVGLLFEIGEGSFTGRQALFFFKESQVPSSTNRFAYGTVILPTGSPEEALLDGCLEFAASGFHAEKRPTQLRRAVTFTLPGLEGDVHV